MQQDEEAQQRPCLHGLAVLHAPFPGPQQACAAPLARNHFNSSSAGIALTLTCDSQNCKKWVPHKRDGWEEDTSRELRPDAATRRRAAACAAAARHAHHDDDAHTHTNTRAHRAGESHKAVPRSRLALISAVYGSKARSIFLL
mmetsp:Transcript_26662/g.51697  ORF Transcript_26662/g.51697 Transcript_26662/m.51697 type:complete len:143 (+) Transcript_26662:190-618(+)